MCVLPADVMSACLSLCRFGPVYSNTNYSICFGASLYLSKCIYLTDMPAAMTRKIFLSHLSRCDTCLRFFSLSLYSTVRRG